MVIEVTLTCVGVEIMRGTLQDGCIALMLLRKHNRRGELLLTEISHPKQHTATTCWLGVE